MFSKTTQGGSKKLTDSKWLVNKSVKPQLCTVRPYQKLIQERLFLTANPNWNHPQSKGHCLSYLMAIQQLIRYSTIISQLNSACDICYTLFKNHWTFQNLQNITFLLKLQNLEWNDDNIVKNSYCAKETVLSYFKIY